MDTPIRICFVRPNEGGKGRPGHLVAEPDAQGCAHLSYGGFSGEGSSFELVRRHDSGGAPDTWHGVDECPHKNDPALCPYAEKPAPQAP